MNKRSCRLARDWEQKGRHSRRGSAHTEREVGILDGVLSLVHSNLALGPSPTAQQLHVFLD